MAAADAAVDLVGQAVTNITIWLARPRVYLLFILLLLMLFQVLF